MLYEIRSEIALHQNATYSKHSSHVFHFDQKPEACLYGSAICCFVGGTHDQLPTAERKDKYIQLPDINSFYCVTALFASVYEISYEAESVYMTYIPE
jgi:hypothetical protein